MEHRWRRCKCQGTGKSHGKFRALADRWAAFGSSTRGHSIAYQLLPQQWSQQQRHCSQILGKLFRRFCLKLDLWYFNILKKLARFVIDGTRSTLMPLANNLGRW